MRASGLLSPWALVVLLLSACASTPTWEGMSEDEISGWRGMNIEAAEAQAYRKAGLDRDAVAEWRQVGLVASDRILAWNESGWTPDSAAPWLQQKFDLDSAVTWAKEKFTADQARDWVDAGFSLEEAMENRAKGLQPVT